MTKKKTTYDDQEKSWNDAWLSDLNKTLMLCSHSRIKPKQGTYKGDNHKNGKFNKAFRKMQKYINIHPP